MTLYNDSYLMHYGVLGMKWGQHKARNAYNKNYSNKQRKHDRAVYGERAERRINRKMNEGYGIQAARAIESNRHATKLQRKEKRQRLARKARNTASSIVSMYLTDQIFFGGRGTRAAINLGVATARVAAKATMYAYCKAYNAAHGVHGGHFRL